jgi:hypothetical protein
MVASEPELELPSRVKVKLESPPRQHNLLRNQHFESFVARQSMTMVREWVLCTILSCPSIPPSVVCKPLPPKDIAAHPPRTILSHSTRQTAIRVDYVSIYMILRNKFQPRGVGGVVGSAGGWILGVQHSSL